MTEDDPPSLDCNGSRCLTEAEWMDGMNLTSLANANSHCYCYIIEEKY